MQDHALAHAEKVDPFLAVLAIIEPLDGQAIAERLDRIMKGNAMVAPVDGGLSVIPSNSSSWIYVLVISSRFKIPK